MRGAYKKDGRRHAMGKAVKKYMGYGMKQNLAVKGILRRAYACACWARDKVRDFVKYFKFHEKSEC